MSLAALNRPSSKRLSDSPDRLLHLPHPCMNLMGLELIANADLKDCHGQPLIPEKRYSERIDPLHVLQYGPYSAEALFDTAVIKPRCAPMQIRGDRKFAIETTDGLTSAYLDLEQAVDEFHERFCTACQTAEGKTVWQARKSVSAAQREYKASIRGNIQKAYLRYQLRTLWELKARLREDVFKPVFPGAYCPVIPDPTLAVSEVRVPEEIWPAFKNNDAIVLRHPVLKVIYRLHPVQGSDICIAINPNLFSACAGDCDGDSLFISPIPKHLDGGHMPLCSDLLVEDEAMMLIDDLPTDNRHWMPVADMPHLSLKTREQFMRFIETKGVRKRGNAISGPMSNHEYWTASLAAAGRFRWEKDAIAQADRIRRSLLVILDGNVEALKAVNAFCSVVTQKAIDAGKHHTHFPLNLYSAAFSGRYQCERGMQFFEDPEGMADELCQISGGDDYTNAWIIAHTLWHYGTPRSREDGEQEPEFFGIGVHGLIAKYFPWLGLCNLKRNQTASGNQVLPEAEMLMGLSTAKPGSANLFI